MMTSLSAPATGSLSLVGLGLGSEKDVTVAGLEAIREADSVYLEAYTSVLGVRVSVLEKFFGRTIHVADRYKVESGVDEILERATTLHSTARRRAIHTARLRTPISYYAQRLLE